MRKKIRLRYTGPQPRMGLIAGIIFVVIGLFLIIPQSLGFGIIWTLIALIATGFSFREKDIVFIEDQDEKTVEERLSELKRLYHEKLITTQEYEKRRLEIISKI